MRTVSRESGHTIWNSLYHFTGDETDFDTVEPAYAGHPRDLRNWPLNTGGLLIQDR